MLELQNINYQVRDKANGEVKVVLKNINLKVEKGDFMVITGHNGGGKSTLAKIIMGLEEPTSGKIFFEGTDITELSINERANLGIGFAFQQPVRFKGLTVHDILKFATGEALTVSKACEYLTEVGLCALEYVNREIDDSLSGGEMKRIEIAALLARKTSLSVFDEPEAGIDLWSFSNLISIFKRLRKDNEHAIIVISHQERILENANRIVLVTDGEIELEGNREKMLSRVLESVTSCELCEEGMYNE